MAQFQKHIVLKTGLILLIFPIFSSQFSSRENDPREGHPLEESLDKCGGVVSTAGDGFSSISYKFMEPLAPKEGCLWTLSVENWTSIDIDIQYSYLNQADYFQIGTFSQPNNYSTLTWTQLDRSSPLRVEVDGPTAFFQLVTQDKTHSLGFKMTFEGSGSQVDNSLFLYSNEFYDLEHDCLVYPSPEDTEYVGNQRTTMVIHSPKGDGFFVIRHIDIENSTDCQNDALVVYTQSFQWGKTWTFCGMDSVGIESKFTPYTDRADPIVLLFQSDENDAVGTGFEIYWN